MIKYSVAIKVCGKLLYGVLTRVLGYI